MLDPALPPPTTERPDNIQEARSTSAATGMMQARVAWLEELEADLSGHQRASDDAGSAAASDSRGKARKARTKHTSRPSGVRIRTAYQRPAKHRDDRG